MGALRPTGLSSSAFSTRYLMEHNANVATVGPANILRRRPITPEILRKLVEGLR